MDWVLGPEVVICGMCNGVLRFEHCRISACVLHTKMKVSYDPPTQFIKYVGNTWALLSPRRERVRCLNHIPCCTPTTPFKTVLAPASSPQTMRAHLVLMQDLRERLRRSVRLANCQLLLSQFLLAESFRIWVQSEKNLPVF